jgi:methyl acetate hydrolase
LQAHQAVTMLLASFRRYHTMPSFPRAEEILVLDHGERRMRRPAGPPGRSAGPDSPTPSTGSIERTGSRYWATQILPFGDPTSFGYLDLETAAYATGEVRAAA